MLSNIIILIIALLCAAGFILLKKRLFQTMSVSFFGIVSAFHILLLKVRIWQSEHLYIPGDIEFNALTPEEKAAVTAKVVGHWQQQQAYYQGFEFTAFALIIFFILISIIQSFRKS